MINVELIYTKESLEAALERVTGVPVSARLGITSMVTMACSEIVLGEKSISIEDVATIRRALIDLKTDGLFKFSNPHLVAETTVAFHEGEVDHDAVGGMKF